MAEETANTTASATTTIAEVLAVSTTEPEPILEVEEKQVHWVSFKEETNVVDELPEPQKKALAELKRLVQEALNKRELTAPIPKEEKTKSSAFVEATAPKEENAAEKDASLENAPPPPPMEEEKTAAEETLDDGAKTVEAIEETIVSVATPTELAPPAEAPLLGEQQVPVVQQLDPEHFKEEASALEPENVSIWGVPLLADKKSDVVLLKFLRARDFKVKEAFTMLRNTVRWRNDFNIEALLEEDLGTELNKVVYISGVDKEGHPVCYNVYGEFQNKGLYQSTFGEKPEKFLRWRVQFLERSIRKDLDFRPDGICRFVQVNDLKASPGPFKRELKIATNQALHLLQDNYPEFVAKQVFINVPWWYLAFYKMISPFFTQRTKNKFVFAGPSKSAETLFKYIAPEQIPAQYGGLSKDAEQEFTTADTATEEIIKPATKSTIEFPLSEACTFVWEARVIGWEISYGAEFVPNAEGGYTLIIQKPRKIALADETVLSGRYKAAEAGKVVLTFDNSASFKKKKLLYRSKTKPSE